jgi:hypothetical protein
MINELIFGLIIGVDAALLLFLYVLIVVFLCMISDGFEEA